MKSPNLAIVLAKYTFGVMIKNIVYFPVWWYSSGALLVFRGVGRQIITTWESLALGVWLKNIMRPMYGQYDIPSRIISFFMRCIQIFFRSLMMIFLTLIIFSAFIFYLALPLATVWLILRFYIINV